MHLTLNHSAFFKLTRFICLASLASIAIYSCAEPNSMTILQDKPVFTLKLEASNTSHFVRLNGVAIHIEFSDQGQISTVLPINHWMKSGENTLGVDILPSGQGEPINPNAKVKLELQVRNHGQDEVYTVANLEFEGKYLREGRPTKNSTTPGRLKSGRAFAPDQNGDIAIGTVSATPRAMYEGAMLFERTIDIPSSLPLWAFFDSDELPNYDEMSDDDYYSAMKPIFEEYEKVQNGLANGDADKIMPMFEERNRETDAAFYLKPGTTREKLSAALKAAMANDNRELVEITPEDLTITLEENRKLVSLTRNHTDSAIGFNFKNGEGSENYNLMFRQENGKWILTR